MDNITNKLRISFYEKDRNSDNIQEFLSVWDILYAKIVAFNNNNKNRFLLEKLNEDDFFKKIFQIAE